MRDRGLLPLLRLRRGRRRVQVRRAAGKGRIPGGGAPPRGALRHSDSGVAKSGEPRESAAEREALIKIHEIALAYFREQLASPAGAKIARVSREGSRPHPGDDRSAADRLRAAVARRAASTPAEGGLLPAADRDERPGHAPRRWQRGRSVSQSIDDSDRARHRHRDRVRRPRARSGSDAEIPELAGNADLYEEPHALRPQPDERRTCARATSR